MRLVLIITSLLLASCVKYVDVPIYSCPAPPDTVMPLLKTDQITKQNSTDEKLSAITYDFVNLKKFAQKCIVIINGYKYNIQPDLEVTKQ